MGVTPPKPPAFDYLAQQIITTYYMVSRERRYIETHPLPVSVSDITNVVTIHPINVQRSVLDPIIFELDNITLKEAETKQENIAQ